jgi:hypothetical protein
MKTTIFTPDFKNTLKITFVSLGLVALTACNKTNSTKKADLVQQQVVTQSELNNVRLADGMPLTIQVSTRWTIEDKASFESQFNSVGTFDSLIFTPRQQELANMVSNRYNNVDSVFTGMRHVFINDLKGYLLSNLGEEGVSVDDVIISNVIFPSNYTRAKETLALQEQELKRIRKQSVIDLENSEARKQQAIAQGEIDKEQARLTAEVEKINAETEGSRRQSMMARAETEKQVAEKRAESDARRQVLMAEADAEKQKLYAAAELERQTKLKDLEVKKQTELNLVAIEKEKLREQMLFDQQVQMADLCSKNPTYATYLINKQLANNVQIAVLPSGQDATLFQGLLNNGLTSKK